MPHRAGGSTRVGQEAAGVRGKHRQKTIAVFTETNGSAR